MTTLSAEKRETGEKPKRLRREGFIPGVVCGRDLKETVLIKIPEKDAAQFIRDNKKGMQVTLDVAGEKMKAIVKEYSYNALKKQVENLDFQALAKGEKISTSAEIVLKNEQFAKGSVNQELSEVHYRAEAEHLIDSIVIDFEKIPDVRTMKVSDLDIYKDKNITVTTSGESTIFSVTAGSALLDEDEEADEAEE